MVNGHSSHLPTLQKNRLLQLQKLQTQSVSQKIDNFIQQTPDLYRKMIANARN
jgi:t-SNARE complex subunit (syntaxin)